MILLGGLWSKLKTAQRGHGGSINGDTHKRSSFRNACYTQIKLLWKHAILVSLSMCIFQTGIWCILKIPALRRLKQEDHKLEASLGNTVGARPYLEEKKQRKDTHTSKSELKRPTVSIFATCAHKNISKKTQLFVLLRYILSNSLTGQLFICWGRLFLWI